MNKKLVDCIFCDSRSNYWFTYQNKLSDYPYDIYQCTICGAGFVYPIPSEKELLSYYTSPKNSHEMLLHSASSQDIYSAVMKKELEYPNSSLDAERISLNIIQIVKSGHVLDVGAGYGFFSKSISKLGFKVTAIELGELTRKVFYRMNGFKADNIYFNHEFANEHKSVFDVVLLSQVLEHLPMSISPVELIRTVLKEEGLCVIAVPHFKSYLSILQRKNDMFIVPPEHLNFFTKKSLIHIFEKNGFKCLKVETVSRYDFNKIRKKYGLISFALILALKIFFKFSDYSGNGMFLNVYFKKR